MKVIVRVAQPKDNKERLFHLDVPIDDLKDPGIGYVELEGREYVLEVHHEIH